MWSNWSNTQTSDAPVVRPSGDTEIANLVRETSGVLRPFGAGHSFTALVPGADTIVAATPRSAQPVISVNKDRVRLDANTSLRDLSLALASQGRAFRNLGDINVQTLAGATATATHGTGALLPCLAADITAMRLVSGTAEVIDIDTQDMPGAQVALGLLGIITEIELRTVAAFNLRRRAAVRPVAELMESLTQKWADHRNYEVFLLPHSGKGVGIAHDLSTDPPGKAPLDLDEFGLAYLRVARHLRHISPGLRRAAVGLLAAFMSDEDFVGESWRILCSTRNTKFTEMEYHLPPDNALDAVQEVQCRLARDYPDVWFPIEIRQTAGDQAWLSPFQHGPRVSVAVHMGASENNRSYFRDCETIFRTAGGRPHWGKIHSLARTDLEELYPDLPKFDALRQRLDPSDRFLSPALAKVFRP